MSEADFISAIHTGVDKKDTRLYIFDPDDVACAEANGCCEPGRIRRTARA